MLMMTRFGPLGGSAARSGEAGTASQLQRQTIVAAQPRHRGPTDSGSDIPMSANTSRKTVESGGPSVLVRNSHIVNGPRGRVKRIAPSPGPAAGSTHRRSRSLFDENLVRLG